MRLKGTWFGFIIYDATTTQHDVIEDKRDADRYTPVCKRINALKKQKNIFKNENNILDVIYKKGVKTQYKVVFWLDFAVSQGESYPFICFTLD